MAAAKPIALVIGATGVQGGSVANALLSDYHVRTLSRNPDKDAAKALAAKGVEVIKGDLTDIPAVTEALKGVDSVFLVTQFWEHFDKDREVAEAKPFIDAVAAAGVKHFVFSTLEHVSKVTGGRITKVKHFDGKGEITEYIQSKGIPCVFVYLAAYFENFLGFFKPNPAGDGTFALTLPDMGEKTCNFVSPADLGPAVANIFKHWDAYVGKHIPIVSENIKTGDLIVIFADVIGKPVKFNPVPYEVFAGFGFPGAEDLAEMFRFYADGPIDRDPTTFLALNPSAKKAREWAEAHKDGLLKAWGFA